MPLFSKRPPLLFSTAYHRVTQCLSVPPKKYKNADFGNFLYLRTCVPYNKTRTNVFPYVKTPTALRSSQQLIAINSNIHTRTDHLSPTTAAAKRTARIAWIDPKVNDRVTY